MNDMRTKLKTMYERIIKEFSRRKTKNGVNDSRRTIEICNEKRI